MLLIPACWLHPSQACGPCPGAVEFGLELTRPCRAMPRDVPENGCTAAQRCHRLLPADGDGGDPLSAAAVRPRVLRLVHRARLPDRITRLAGRQGHRPRQLRQGPAAPGRGPQAGRGADQRVGGRGSGLRRCCCTSVLGLRPEILSRQVRDVDDGGRALWIPDGKTKNARRRLSVPEELQPMVKAVRRPHRRGSAVRGGRPDAALHEPGAVEVAAPLVPEGRRARGLPAQPARPHSTLAIEAGSTSGAVIAQLGHSSFRTTERYRRQGSLPRRLGAPGRDRPWSAGAIDVLGELEGLDCRGSTRAGHRHPRPPQQRLAYRPTSTASRRRGHPHSSSTGTPTSRVVSSCTACETTAAAST